jgi:CRP-like cAMP-binding protein
MTLEEELKAHAFVAGLSARQIGKLSGLAREISFTENELVLRNGQQSQHFYLLLSGSVCVEVRSRSYVVTVQSLGPGEAFGWSSLLGQQDTLFQVRAREVSKALCFEGAALDALFHEDAELGAEMLRRALRLVVGRVQATERVLGEICGIRMPRPAPVDPGLVM